MNRDFWYDVMRSGAILGIVMMLSRIFEHYVLYYSSIELTTMSVLYFG